MHIKRLTLRGFKTYKDQTHVDFSSGCNIIVGTNGSGKSNLLTAVQFVLAEKAVGRDKTAFLHEGASTAVLNAWVELVLCNKDRRLKVIDKDEVSIRRKFGTNKDEYIIDGKHVTKTEFRGLLESAGFSSSNPYHVVKQGKVAELTMMSDPSRLNLLREIAGTKVYDERRFEALKTLEDTKARELDVDRTVEVTTNRVEELKAEQAELHEYQKLEREKKLVEAVVYEKRLKGVETEIETLEEKYADVIRKVDAFGEKLQKVQSDKSGAETASDLALKEAKKLELQRDELKKLELELHEELTRVELQIKDGASDAKASIDTRKRKEKELTDLRKEVEETRKKLDEHLTPEVRAAESKHAAAKSELMKLQDEIAQLRAKTNRGREFKNVKERNSVLKAESKKIETRLTELQRDVDKIRTEITESAVTSESEVEVKKLKKEREALEAQKTTLAEGHKKCNQEIAENEKKFREAREALSNFEEEKRNAVQETDKHIRAVERTMRDAQVKANAAAKVWAMENGREGSVYGSLLELIDVEEQVQAAVEVAAGNQLFNLLVDNSETATEIITHLKKNRIGGTTITPLRDIRVAPERYPSEDVMAGKAAPLARFIKAEAHVQPAVQQVFGKFLVVDNKDVGNEFRHFGLDCVTPEGEKVTRKGIVSGGCVSQLTRMKNYRAYQLARERRREIEEKIAATEDNLDKLREEREARILENTRTAEESANASYRQAEIVDRLHEIENIERRTNVKGERLRRQQEETEREVELLKETLSRNRREVLNPTLGDLTDEETTRLSTAEAEIKSREKSVDELDSLLRDAQRQTEQVSASLEKFLIPKAQHLEEELQQAAPEENAMRDSDSSLLAQKAETTERLTTIQRQRKECSTRLESVQAEVEKLVATSDELDQKERAIRSKMTSNDTFARTARRNLDDARRRREELLAAKSSAIDRSPAETAAFDTLAEPELVKRSARLSEQLASFTNINKKAVDQLTSFIEEQDKLHKNREKLAKASSSIYELIETLDLQKDSTLMQTFENVNRHFGKVFGQLVPGGRAKLLLKKLPAAEIERLEAEKREKVKEVLERRRAAERENARPTNGKGETADAGEHQLPKAFLEVEMAQGGKVDVFTGVGIKASFSGAEKTYHALQQLSGGQKTIVALALIFAIQLCDPAPFYLFDEIDAALDDQYRSAVATMVGALSENVQFIVSSFRRQLLEAGEKYFKVTSRDRCSSVAEVDKPAALRVIEEQASGAADL